MNLYINLSILQSYLASVYSPNWDIPARVFFNDKWEGGLERVSEVYEQTLIFTGFERYRKPLFHKLQ